MMYSGVLRKTWCIARVTIVESFRRKDPYVVIILAALVIFVAVLFGRYGSAGLGKFIKDVSFSITHVLAVAVCVITAARQLPTEMQNRTLYPVLAKPISRTTLFVGKFVGIGLLASMVVLFFSFEVLLTLFVLDVSVSFTFLQVVYLRILAMWVIAALVLTSSLYFTVGANITICLLLALSMETLTDTLLTIRQEMEATSAWVVEGIYWVLPHLEFLDLSKREVHGWAPAPLWVMGFLTVYAAGYAMLFLVFGCLRFRRVAL